jgi:tetratricopeptide (TPR) repeat protein
MSKAPKAFTGEYLFTLPLIISLLIFCLFLVSCSEEKVSVSKRDYLTPDILCGTVQFSDGCSPKLDTLISFGIALIHHMTYEDAEHTFSKVIETDPDCFWGYWGKAMTYIHPLWPDIPDEKMLKDGYILSQKALNLAKTEKEKLYGSAVAAFFQDGLNRTEPERLISFDQGWRIAAKELPGDIEAALFSVLGMLSTVSPNDKTYKVQREAGSIAEKTLEVIPDHPGGFHYAIHAYDYPPLAMNAIRVARNYYKLAPEIPHALHMPTHIFTRLGYWDESINLNLRSAAAAMKIPVNGQISGQYFHALDYLVYAYLQKSEYKKANEVALLLDTLGGIFETTPVTAYSIAAIPGRVALEFQNWKAAENLSLPHHADFPWNKFPQYEALTYFAKGIGAGRNGNAETALNAFQKLEELQKSFKNTEANKYWIDQIEIQKIAVKAWEMYARGEKEKSIEFMIKASELEDRTEKNPVTPGSLLPAHEMLADIYLELKRPDDALKQYELSLKNNPNRFNSLYGAGKSAELAGNMQKAKHYFTALINLNKSSEVNREQITHAVDVTGRKI